MLRHVDHTAHYVASLPRSPIVLIALVPPLGLGKKSRRSPRKPGEQSPPTSPAGLPAAPPPVTQGDGREPARTSPLPGPRDRVSGDSKSLMAALYALTREKPKRLFLILRVCHFKIWSTYFLLKEKLHSFKNLSPYNECFPGHGWLFSTPPNTKNYERRIQLRIYQ